VLAVTVRDVSGGHEGGSRRRYGGWELGWVVRGSKSDEGTVIGGAGHALFGGEMAADSPRVRGRDWARRKRDRVVCSLGLSSSGQWLSCVAESGT
jgi:hypothetical protein